jgi:hypothetical protein
MPKPNGDYWRSNAERQSAKSDEYLRLSRLPGNEAKVKYYLLQSNYLARCAERSVRLALAWEFYND